MTITTVGIDLAKNVFAVHCVDQHGKTVLVKPKVSRAALPELIASLPPCVIGMEACSWAYYWARLFRQYGHEPRLMAAKFVSPYRMAGKSGMKPIQSRWPSWLMPRRSGFWRHSGAMEQRHRVTDRTSG